MSNKICTQRLPFGKTIQAIIIANVEPVRSPNLMHYGVKYNWVRLHLLTQQHFKSKNLCMEELANHELLLGMVP